MSITPEGKYLDDKTGKIRELTWDEKCQIADEKYDMWREEQMEEEN